MPIKGTRNRYIVQKSFAHPIRRLHLGIIIIFIFLKMALSVSVPEAEAAVSGMNEQVYMAPFMVIVMCLNG